MNKTLFYLLFPIFLVTTVSADNNIVLTTGAPPVLLPVTGNHVQIRTSLPERRSICCQVQSVTAQGAVKFGEDFLLSNVSFLRLRNRGADHPILSLVQNEQGQGRKCFYYEDPQVNATTILFLLTSFNNTNFGNTYAHCTETTLYGGFNTSVTDFNFVEISNLLTTTNLSNGVIIGKIVATDSITNQVLLDREFTINPEDRIDIDIHSVTGAGKFGPIIIYHDGPPGSLRAVTSQYRIVSQNPLDFEPVAQQKFTVRAGNY
jgi:hypothetical protein